MNFLKKNLSVVALIIVIIGAAAYYMNKGGSDETVSESGPPSSDSEATFLGFASKLETVSFNPAIFSDPRFTALKDIRTAVVSEPTGRRDPFAPLSGVPTTP